MSKIAVQLVDDHHVVRNGFRRMLEDQGIDVVAQSDSAEQAWQDFLACKPDVVIMDISMPGMGGMEGIRRILSRDSEARIIILTMHGDELANRAIQAGARGYLSKTSAPRSLIRAVHEVFQGRTYVELNGGGNGSEEGRRRQEENPFDKLSRREFEVLLLLLDEKSVREIADILGLSPKTVHAHKEHIFAKLGLTSMVGLTRLAIQRGLIDS